MVTSRIRAPQAFGRSRASFQASDTSSSVTGEPSSIICLTILYYSALLRRRKDLFLEQRRCFYVRTEVVVDIGIEMSCIDVSHAHRGDGTRFQPCEIESWVERIHAPGPPVSIGIDRLRWRHVIKEPAMFVINDDQQGGFALSLVFPDGIEDIPDQDFALFDIVVGMLVACGKEAVGRRILAVCIAGFDEAVGWQTILSQSERKSSIKAKISALFHQPFEGHGHGRIVVVNP
jgi:hypothetical protein